MEIGHVLNFPFPLFPLHRLSWFLELEKFFKIKKYSLSMDRLSINDEWSCQKIWRAFFLKFMKLLTIRFYSRACDRRKFSKIDRRDSRMEIVHVLNFLFPLFPLHRLSWFLELENFFKIEKYSLSINDEWICQKFDEHSFTNSWNLLRMEIHFNETGIGWRTIGIVQRSSSRVKIVRTKER